MRIFFAGNNWVGWKVAEWLSAQNEHIVGLALHPQEKRKFGAEILSSVNVDALRIFDGSSLHHPETLTAIRALNADIAVSVLFGYILTAEFIGLFPQSVLNLHPAYLPFNRGQYPNVWSIVEHTPPGVTLHYMDTGIDTGDIIAQREVPAEALDTGETLYRKLERTAVDLFIETWPLIRNGEAPRVRQSLQQGTYHRTRDVEAIDEINLDETYTARELIDLIRARTFPPYSGAYFKVGERKIYLRLQLMDEEMLKNERHD